MIRNLHIMIMINDTTVIINKYNDINSIICDQSTM